MFYTTRYTFKYGHEWDPMDCTFKEFETFEKAEAYCFRYAKGIRFAGVTIEDENGRTLFEITSVSEVFDYR